MSRRFSFKRFPTSIGTVYSGCCPDISTLSIVEDNNVACIWNLGRELDGLLDEERRYVEHVVHGDIQDYSVPDNKEHFLHQLKYVCSLLREGHSVFVHCMGGHGRTGMALACIKRQLEGVSAEVALAASMAHCHGPEEDSQVQYVIDLL